MSDHELAPAAARTALATASGSQRARGSRRHARWRAGRPRCRPARRGAPGRCRCSSSGPARVRLAQTRDLAVAGDHLGQHRLAAYVALSVIWTQPSNRRAAGAAASCAPRAARARPHRRRGPSTPKRIGSTVAASATRSDTRAWALRLSANRCSSSRPASVTSAARSPASTTRTSGVSPIASAGRRAVGVGADDAVDVDAVALAAHDRLFFRRPPALAVSRSSSRPGLPPRPRRRRRLEEVVDLLLGALERALRLASWIAAPRHVLEQVGQVLPVVASVEVEPVDRLGEAQVRVDARDDDARVDGAAARSRRATRATYTSMTRPLSRIEVEDVGQPALGRAST